MAESGHCRWPSPDNHPNREAAQCPPPRRSSRSQVFFLVCPHWPHSVKAPEGTWALCLRRGSLARASDSSRELLPCCGALPAGYAGAKRRQEARGMAALAPGPAEIGEKGAVDGAGHAFAAGPSRPCRPGLVTGSILTFSPSFPVLLPTVRCLCVM